jgi:hypothetical protein
VRRTDNPTRTFLQPFTTPVTKIRKPSLFDRVALIVTSVAFDLLFTLPLAHCKTGSPYIRMEEISSGAVSSVERRRR